MFSKNNLEFSYVHECQIRGFFNDIESLHVFDTICWLNLFWKWKTNTTFHMLLKSYPYLDWLSKHDEIMFTYESNVNGSSIKCYNIHSTWFQRWNIKLCAQLWVTKMFNILIEQLVRLQILEETLGSGKTFF